MSLHLNNNEERTEALINSKCASLAKIIELNQEALIDILLEYESFETAKDEVWRSLDCLKNISKEFKYLSYGKVDLMCTIFPINLPLYSLVLFAIVPSFVANEVVVRPPVLMREVLQEIVELLNLSEIVLGIKFVDMERSLFNEAFISIADVVMFTGRYENVKNVQEACPDALFIYNGAGVNPVVVTSSADLESAVDKTVEARVFNSGQDCHGPDMIFVHEKIVDDFQQRLVTKLCEIKVGDYQDRDVKVGPLIDVDNLSVVNSFFNTHAKSIVYGGEIDFKRGIVYPTVIKENVRDLRTFTTTEFFSPVFYLLIYRNNNDLRKYFSQESYSDFAMYTSIFGNTPYSSEMPNTVILQDKILNDVERGNDPFGGYGLKANYASYHGVYHCRPILLSREISTYLQEYGPKKESMPKRREKVAVGGMRSHENIPSFSRKTSPRNLAMISKK